MEADGAVGRNVTGCFGHEEGHKGHHAEIGIERPHLVQNLLVLEVWRLDDRKSLLQRELLDWIQRLALLVWSTINGNNLVLAFFQDCFQAGFAEGLLAHDDQSHGRNSHPFLSKLHRIFLLSSSNLGTAESNLRQDFIRMFTQ